MPISDLYRLLGSIGKGVFVRYYHEFANSALTNQEIVELLPSEYTLKSRRTRTSGARRIFREGLEKDALRLIINSDRLDNDIVEQAKELLGRA
jgi:hypothetical protein